MIRAVQFSTCEHRAGDKPRAGRIGDRYDLHVQLIHFDPETFDVFAIARNQRTGERWSRVFAQEPEDRHLTRALDWLLELAGLTNPAELLGTTL